MEGKGVRVPISSVTMVVVLILGLVLAQTHVEAKSCCKDTTARNCFDRCRLVPELCAIRCGCIIITDTTCPSDYPSYFCMLGCASSMCSTISTLPNSDFGEEAAVEGCNNTCSDLCNKDSNAVFTA